MTSIRRVLVAASLLCAATGNWGWAADDAADPLQLPKTILALRGDETDRTQLQIVFDRTRDGETVAPITAWIGADYVALIDGKRMTITDLRLRRRFIVDEEAGTVVNLSLYGDVMFRRVELVRRMEIAAALTKDRSDTPQSLDPFWIESELGITGAGKLRSEVLPHRDGDATVFDYAGQRVASVIPSDTAVPSNVDHAYGTFLRGLSFHPSIARWLGANGQLPKRLDFTSEARGKTEKISLRLRSAAASAGDFPLPPRLSVVLLPWGTDDPDVGLLREILPRMGNAVMEPVDREKGIAADRAAIQDDFKNGHKFAAALQLTELALRWGRAATSCDAAAVGPCLSKTEIDRELRGDPRSVAMFKATALQDRDPAKALAIWRDIDRSDVPNGYVVDVFIARAQSESGDREAAAKAFALAFAGDAHIPALYRELGDHFARASRLDLAWLCYDLGRALPNREPPDALTGIDDIEQQLAAHYPDLF